MGLDKETALQFLESCLGPGGLNAICEVAYNAGTDYQKRFNEVYTEAIRLGAEALRRELRETDGLGGGNRYS